MNQVSWSVQVATRNDAGKATAGEHKWPPGPPGLPGRAPDHLAPDQGRGGIGPWGSQDSAGACSASQTVIVLDTPLLSFPRRQAGGNSGGTGYPEIKSFYELPDLAGRGTRPTGTVTGSLPYLVPSAGAKREGKGEQANTQWRGLCWGAPGQRSNPRGHQQGRGESVRSSSVVNPHLSASKHSGKEVRPSLSMVYRRADHFPRFFWKSLLTPPGIRKVKRIQRKTQKTSTYLV